MRITLEADPADTGMVRVTIRVPGYGEGEMISTIITETVPVIEIKGGVQAEVFVPDATHLIVAEDGAEFPLPGAGVSVYRRPVPADNG